MCVCVCVYVLSLLSVLSYSFLTSLKGMGLVKGVISKPLKFMDQKGKEKPPRSNIFLPRKVMNHYKTNKTNPPSTVNSIALQRSDLYLWFLQIIYGINLALLKLLLVFISLHWISENFIPHWSKHPHLDLITFQNPLGLQGPHYFLQNLPIKWYHTVQRIFKGVVLKKFIV